MKNQDCYIRDFQTICEDYLCNRGELISPQCFINQNCLEDNNLIIKICMPDEEISAFTLSHLLNDLYVVNRELNKIIIHGLEEDTGKKLDIKNIFELKVKEVRPGSCSIIMNFVINVNIDVTLAIYVPLFIYIMTNPDVLKKIHNEHIKKRVPDFHKRIHKLKNVKEVKFISKNNIPENVTEDRMIDFYA